MNFTLLATDTQTLDPVAVDAQLLRRANGPRARIWTAPRGLVMPRSYLRYPNVEAVRARFAARGLPVFVRASGGGLVPQGPGILNVSLAYPLPGPLGRWMEPVYLHLCALLANTLAQLGIVAHPAPVAGSFCDGRFNLACVHAGEIRKIAGTAQYWRLDARRDSGYTVLAHALLLVQPDLAAVHRDLNAFEAALGSGRTYDARKTTSVARVIGTKEDADLMLRLRRQLHTTISRAVPPASPGD